LNCARIASSDLTVAVCRGIERGWIDGLSQRDQAVNPANTISAGSVTRTIVSLFFLSAIPSSARDLSADNHLFACENQSLILTVKVCFFCSETY